MEGKIKSTKKQSRNALREKISWIKKQNPTVHCLQYPHLYICTQKVKSF